MLSDMSCCAAGPREAKEHHPGFHVATTVLHSLSPAWSPSHSQVCTLQPHLQQFLPLQPTMSLHQSSLLQAPQWRRSMCTGCSRRPCSQHKAVSENSELSALQWCWQPAWAAGQQQHGKEQPTMLVLRPSITPLQLSEPGISLPCGLQMIPTTVQVWVSRLGHRSGCSHVTKVTPERSGPCPPALSCRLHRGCAAGVRGWPGCG